MNTLLVLTGASALFILFFHLSRRRSPHKAPLVHYWIPWVGSGLDMGKDPDGFFRNVTAKYGPVFTLKVFGRDLTYVTSPSLISEIYRNPKKFDFTETRMEFGSKVFAMDHAFASSSVMKDKIFPVHHRFMSPQEIKPLLESYAKHAHGAILESRSKFDGASTPLIPFIIPLAYKAAAYAFFGRSFPAEKSYKPYKQFDSVFHLKMAGVPDFFFKKNILAWDDVVQMIEDYLKEPHDDSAEFIHVLARETRAGGFTDHDFATYLGLELWALQSNAVWTAYWIIVLQLQRPEGLAPLISEVDRARKSWAATNPEARFEENISEFAADESLPLLVSTIQETLRFSVFNQSIRQVQEHLELGGYEFDKGERVLCAIRTIHLDEEIHENAQSFVPDRYLKTKRFMKNGKPVPNHTLPFGGGVSQCEGRHFAMGELKILVLLLLLYTTIEMDPKSEQRPSLGMERIGAGVLQPKGDLQVVIRKRD